MEVTNEFLHNVENSILDKVFYYLKHQKEYVMSPVIYVNTRTGRVVMGEQPDWKCYDWELAIMLCVPYKDRLLADNKAIRKWVRKGLFAGCSVW